MHRPSVTAQHWNPSEHLAHKALAPRRLLLLFAIFAAFAVTLPGRAAEPFLKKGDVIALVGGEDMVVAGELGYLELLLTRALPDYKLRFRSLAWEGDTVFEQRRDLNFPPLEAQLDQVGATVVICQFGQMESLMGKGQTPKAKGEEGAAGKAEVAEFIAAYEKLIERMSGGGKRRVAVVEPFGFTNPMDRKAAVLKHAALLQKAAAFAEYRRAIHNLRWKPSSIVPLNIWTHYLPERDPADVLANDRIHLSSKGQSSLAEGIADRMGVPFHFLDYSREVETLKALIRAKNRLWFNYWRIENWALLAGDRTNQPSSRDHRDPTKRWFPAERDEFLPLIAAKEREIHALAAQLAAKP